ncbi:N-acetylglucosamine kinase [Paenarthrobacter sp. NPDC092416]|uniref:N-acetylglucosamine kinase n=1 Tax=Paenarthrobacter sp. NPDC092416 TaxID=3364386 RepID=UPI0038245B46
MDAAFDVVLVADVGKSRCRVELRSGTELLGAADQHGFAGVHVDNGPTLAFDLLLETTSMLPPGLPISTLTGIGAAVAGVEASAEKSRELATMLAQRFSVPAAVLSDATAAQLGALQGAPGTTLIVGTGAVAFRFDEAGILHRADGWGPYLGDRGSGRWIGQKGLQAVLNALDGGPATSLSAAAGALVESPDMLPGWLAAAENPYRAMARFAPLVLHAAEAGDGVAQGIVDDACRILTHTVKLASGGDTGSTPRVALLGGVVSSEFFGGLLRNALASAGIEVVAALGDGLDGAALAATRRGLLQERYIHRDGTNWPD